MAIFLRLMYQRPSMAGRTWGVPGFGRGQIAPVNTQTTHARVAVPVTPSDTPHIVILMAVWNGADHLEEQLRSIATQFHDRWELQISDDRSSDESRAIVEAFARDGHTVSMTTGPCRGAAANFMSLVRGLDPAKAGNNWLAFSDQDDVWMPERLRHGVTALGEIAPDHPALYCAATLITDDDLNFPRMSPPRPKPPGFRNALVQNIASGNTILLNAAATRLAIEAAQEVDEVVVHDWWIYQLISGAGGTVIHDDRPALYYRQHPDNQIGANDTPRAQIRRLGMLLNGVFRRWNDINIAALSASAHRLTPENRVLLEDFAAMRRASLPMRLLRFRRMRLYRQSLAGTAALWLSVLLRRV